MYIYSMIITMKMKFHTNKRIDDTIACDEKYILLFCQAYISLYSVLVLGKI